MNISIGSSIRVTSKDRNSSKRAIISCINSNKTYDVIFENRLDSKDICEEEGVELNRITTLQDFELNADTSQDPTILKDNGNILFAFKDFESATLKYLESLKNLKSITNQIISIGSTVIVTPDIGKVVTDSQNLDEKNQKDKFAFKYGLVSDISPDGNVEVIYNDQLEELNIARRRIIKIYDDITSRELQRSLYSNLAKSSLQLVRYGWAVRYASIATAILEYTDENFHDIFTKNIANILFIRAKAYIGANKLSSALKVSYKIIPIPLIHLTL